MKRGLMLVVLTMGSALAHHGYGEYNRDVLVSMGGTVQHVVWGNPHVLLTLRTESQGEYLVEWAALYQLSSRYGIKAAPVKEGDQVIVTGSVNKNPEKHILTLVREIRRPADGWRWADSRYTSK